MKFEKYVKKQPIMSWIALSLSLIAAVVSIGRFFAGQDSNLNGPSGTPVPTR